MQGDVPQLVQQLLLQVGELLAHLHLVNLSDIMILNWIRGNQFLNFHSAFCKSVRISVAPNHDYMITTQQHLKMIKILDGQPPYVRKLTWKSIYVRDLVTGVGSLGKNFKDLKLTWLAHILSFAGLLNPVEVKSMIA